MAKNQKPMEPMEPVDLMQTLPDVGPESLRRELAAKEKELESLRAEMASRDAAAQALSDSGPGTYRITVRHAPTKLKRFVVEADNERHAWEKFQTAAIKAAYSPKLAQAGKPQIGIQVLEQFFREGASRGFDRLIEKAVAVVDNRPLFPADLRIIRDKAKRDFGREMENWRTAIKEEYGEAVAVAVAATAEKELAVA